MRISWSLKMRNLAEGRTGATNAVKDCSLRNRKSSVQSSAPGFDDAARWSDDVRSQHPAVGRHPNQTSYIKCQ